MKHKICFISQDYHPSVGGIQTYIREMAREYAELGHDVTVIGNHESEKVGFEKFIGVTCKKILIPVYLLWHLPIISWKLKPDVSFHALWATTGAAILSRWLTGYPRKIVCAIHGREVWQNPLEKVPILAPLFLQLRDRVLLGGIDQCFPVSRYTAQWLLNLGVKNKIITVLYNGVNPEIASKNAVPPTSHSPFKLITICRLIERKGVDTIINALAELRAQGLPVELTIIGEGPEKDRIDELITEHSLHKSVHFLGYVDDSDRQRIIAEHHVFVLASKRGHEQVEGFGLVFLEANIEGVPVIGTDTGGIPDAIEFGVNGWLFEENDHLELARLVTYLYNNPEVLKKAGKDGKKRAEESFTWKIAAEKSLKVIDGFFEKKQEAVSAPTLPTGEKPMNVVIISPYFPPRNRVGALRAFKFAKYLSLAGHNIHVVSIGTRGDIRGYFAEIIDRIQQFILKTPFDNTVSSSGSYSQKKNVKPKPETPMDIWLDRRSLVDGWYPFMLWNARKVRRYIKNVNADVIWSTADPWTSHLLAMNARPKNIPWIADFRDPWTICSVRNVGRPNWVRAVDRYYESQYFKKADAVTFTAENTLEEYKVAYPKAAHKMSVIYNSFDTHSRKKPWNEAVLDSEHINIMFFGRFRPLSPATLAIDFLAQIKEESPEIYNKVRLVSFGKLTDEDEMYANDMGVFSAFTDLPPVSLEDSLSMLNQADMLFLSTEQNRDDIIPQKMWDYLPANPPILAINNSKEIKKLIEMSERGLCFRLNNVKEAAKWFIELEMAEKNRKNQYLPSKKVWEFSAEDRAREFESFLKTFISK